MKNPYYQPEKYTPVVFGTVETLCEYCGYCIRFIDFQLERINKEGGSYFCPACKAETIVTSKQCQKE